MKVFRDCGPGVRADHPSFHELISSSNSYTCDALQITAHTSFLIISFAERLSRCENDSLNAKHSAMKPVRVNSGSLQRKQAGLKAKTSGLVSSSARVRAFREKTPGQTKRNRESR